MAKKKTKTPAKKAPVTEQAQRDAVALASRVATLFARESDGDPARVAELVRDKLGVTKATFSRWVSGSAVPAAGKLELLEKLCAANADTKPGDPVKRRTEPTEAEARLLARVEAAAAMTAMPAWASLVKAINAHDRALTESLRECKPGDLRGIQGQIEALDWLRQRVLKPGRELAEMPLFAQGYAIKCDPVSMTVTASKRAKS